MVTAAAVMAVVRAAGPVFRGAHDGIAFAAHATFRADGYSLCAVGPAAFAEPLPSGDKEVGIDGWNSMEENYAVLYNKKEKGKKKRVWMRCQVMGDLLAIGALDLKGQEEAPYEVQINVRDFFSERYPRTVTYGETYTNFPNLIEKIISNVLSKLDGKAGSLIAIENYAESSSQIQIQSSEIELIREMYPRPRTTEPSGYPGSYPQGILVHGILILQAWFILQLFHLALMISTLTVVLGVVAACMLVTFTKVRLLPYFETTGPHDPRHFPLVPPHLVWPWVVAMIQLARLMFQGLSHLALLGHPGGSTHPDFEFFQHGPNL